MHHWFPYALFALFLWGLWGFFPKLSTKHINSSKEPVTIKQGFGILFALAAVVLLTI